MKVTWISRIHLPVNSKFVLAPPPFPVSFYPEYFITIKINSIFTFLQVKKNKLW
jgi:hypothetical protein